MYQRPYYRYNNRGFLPVGLGFVTGLAAGSFINRPYYYPYYTPYRPYYSPYYF